MTADGETFPSQLVPRDSRSKQSFLPSKHIHRHGNLTQIPHCQFAMQNAGRNDAVVQGSTFLH